MSKISTYSTSTPELSDMLIGTDANDESATKNFLIADILDMVEPMQIDANEYTPTTSVITGISNISFAKGYYAKLGSYVILSAKFQFSNSSTLCSFAFSTPISSSFTTNYDAIMTVGGISTSSIAESLASSSSIVVTVTTPYPSAPLLVSVTGFYKIK